MANIGKSKYTIKEFYTFFKNIADNDSIKPAEIYYNGELQKKPSIQGFMDMSMSLMLRNTGTQLAYLQPETTWNPKRSTYVITKLKLNGNQVYITLSPMTQDDFKDSLMSSTAKNR